MKAFVIAVLALLFNYSNRLNLSLTPKDTFLTLKKLISNKIFS